MSVRHQRSNPFGDSALASYLSEINATPLLTSQEERSLSERVALGDVGAREHMVKANLRLVVNLARGFRGQGLALEDLIEEGNLGLMRAVEGYEGDRGIRFSTYATYWIKQSIRAALIRHGKTIRLPAYMIVLLTKWRRTSACLRDELGRPPLPDEVGATLGLSKKKAAMVGVAMQAYELTRYEEVPDRAESPLESITDERSKSPEDHYQESEDWGRVADRLACLGEREAAIIRLRFGLGAEAPLTLREVGERLALTRERVRQLERDALAELSASCRN
ncbi:MAG: RNA polymerase sigma factor RpoD/SigA [Isosphaeraceae bacterium]|nr:RNA polymerase sigma factor RpoD/SigA [Isosphaeraceae bacterium]